MTTLKHSRGVILSNLSFDYMVLKLMENQTLQIIYIHFLVALIFLTKTPRFKLTMKFLSLGEAA